ncbi:MAG: histidinol-phosphate transaminase [Phycisphaeraceae bacterium]|nr:histidinol-phosphate transaminase [Phycisphaeraceae bacterium]
MSYVRENIEALEPYVPGEQPDDVSVVKLNTNENPYPPPAPVLDAIRAVSGEQLRRYPPAAADRFRGVAAAVHDVAAESVIATNGGDELLRLAVTVFCESAQRGGLAVTRPTYSLYPTLGRIAGTAVVEVDLDDEFGIPDDFAGRVVAAGCRLAILVSPHAPTGLPRPLATLDAIARRLAGEAVLLVDEAYVDFADADALDLVRGGALDNVLVLRTLSKGYALAGLRFGYGIGTPSLVAALDKARDSYNTDIVSQVAATAALEHRDEASESWRRVRAERSSMVERLDARGFTILPSASNFVLARAPETPGAAALYESLKQRRIFVRYFDQPRLSDRLRITVGLPEQNQALIAALDEIL